MEHVHHWLVAPPEEQVDRRVPAVCKDCGDETTFPTVGALEYEDPFRVQRGPLIPRSRAILPYGVNYLADEVVR